MGASTFLNLLISTLMLKENLVSQSCTTPNGINGTCMDIDQCPALLSSRIRTDNYIQITELENFVNQSMCEYHPETDIRLVCCPDIEKYPMDVETTQLFNNAKFPEMDLCGLASANTSYSRTVGGYPVARGQFPWMVMIYYHAEPAPISFCSASLISKEYILTAAHCVYSFNISHVEIGKVNRSATPEYYGEVIQLRWHRDYPIFHREYPDIAVLKVKWLEPETRQPVEFFSTAYSNFICLPRPELEAEIANTYLGYYPFVAGWGKTGFRSSETKEESDILRGTQVPITSTETCHARYKAIGKSIDPLSMCAGYPINGSHDVCEGDSGGPLMVAETFNGSFRYFQIGVTALGYRCGRTDFPSVYTRTNIHLLSIFEMIKEMNAV